jgi:hypothetical protein
MQTYELSLVMRYDTTSAFDSMIAASALSMEIECLGPTMASSVTRQGLLLELPKVYIMDAGDPEIGGPDEMLTSEVTLQVLRDDSSAGGYAFRATVTNATENYA